MTPIQYILVLFALFAILRTVIKAKHRTIPYVWAFVWSLVWVALIVLAILPQTSDLLAAKVGIGRGVDLLIYASITGLFFMVFRLVVKIEALQQEITKLVRAVALKSLEKEE